jgi:ketosteroid isomerase-like protein
MPQDNVELFRRGLAAWSEGDFGVIVEMCHSGVEWTFSDRLPDATGDIRGKQAVSDFLPASRRLGRDLDLRRSGHRRRR